MDLAKLENHAVNVFFTIATLFFGLGVLEKGFNLLGYSIPGTAVSSRRFMVWGVFLLIFAIAVMVKQIRDARSID